MDTIEYKIFIIEKHYNLIPLKIKLYREGENFHKKMKLEEYISNKHNSTNFNAQIIIDVKFGSWFTSNKYYIK